MRWRFIHGPGVDDPLMGLHQDGGDRWSFYWLTDGQGRQYGVADSTGDQNFYRTHVQGHAGTYAGGTSAASSFAADRFGTPQVPQVSFFRNRAYDQRTGRWTQEDPIGLVGGINLYQFNGNNPVTFSDPFGLCKEKYQDDPVKCQQDDDIERMKQEVDEATEEWDKQAASWVGGGGTVKTGMGVAGRLLTTKGAASIGKLFGKGYPTKLNSAGKLQPYDPATGRYLSPAANPGTAQSQLGHFGAGFGQGYAASVTGGMVPDYISNAHWLGQVVGQIIGNIIGAMK